jgi:tellurite resistance protein TerC
MTDLDRFVAEGIRAARRVVVAVVGLTVLVVGLGLLVLPGPAFVVIPVGLAILAVEFEWARRLLRRARRLYESAAQPKKSDLEE